MSARESEIRSKHSLRSLAETVPRPVAFLMLVSPTLSLYHGVDMTLRVRPRVHLQYALYHNYLFTILYQAIQLQFFLFFYLVGVLCLNQVPLEQH